MLKNSRSPVLIRIGLAGLAVVTLTAAVPHVFKPGEVLSSASLNENFADLERRTAVLEANCVGANPWVLVGKNDLFSAFEQWLTLYPLTHYQWGIAYNFNIDNRYLQPHPVIFSNWNGGVRVMSAEYLTGDGDASEPPGAFQAGGVAFLYNTPGTFDDACTAEGKFKQQYWMRSASGISMGFSNGCGGGVWYVRRL